MIRLRRLLPLVLALVAFAGMASAQAPTVLGISPNTVIANSGTFTLTVLGANFQSGSYVLWNSVALSTSYGGPGQLQAIVTADLPTSPGLVSILVVNPNGARSSPIALTVTAVPLSISTSSLPAATVNSPYSATLTAAGGTPPYVWTATTNLPAGLSLSSSGTITGTPVASGTYSFSVQLADSNQGVISRIFSLTVGQPALSITTSALSNATAGQSYRVNLAAAGGVPPYRWAAGQGFPSWLELDRNTGVLTGTPPQVGSFTFTVQLTDSAQGSASRSLSLTVVAPALSITTIPPLFSGTTGLPYSQTFSAAGGTPPYVWSIVSGSTGDLTLDSGTGTLQGTPRNTGTLNFTIQVADSSGAKASQSFSISINAPVLVITTPGTLTAGTVGVAYSQKFSAVGGTPPYSWQLVTGGVAGLDFDSAEGTLSGIPAAPGTYTLTAQARDAAGLSVTKVFTVTVNPSALRIVTETQLPNGALNRAYFQQLVADGGVAPYTWSANGLPDGLTLDAASGSVSGSPLVAGSLSFTVRVTDAARNTAVELFRMTVSLPAAPSITVSGLPSRIDPARQYDLTISVGSAFPVPIAGQAILNFSPEVGGTDNTVQFASGGRTADFTIPAGSTTVVSSIPLALQTGTVGGTISISLRLQAAGQDITPAPAPVTTGQIPRAAPVIRSARVIRNAGGFEIEVTGYSTAREITQASFRFSAASGQTLQSSEVTVQLEAAFSRWFQDAANSRYGSQFVFSQPFTIQGDANAVIPESVTLTNRLGSATANIPR